MKLGNKKLDQVYFFASPHGVFTETFETKEEAKERIEELRSSNLRLTTNTFYGDIVDLGKYISYTCFEIIPVSKDLDLAYADSKNMTELKRNFKDELKGKKDARVVTFNNGLISSVSKKVTTKKVLFVEELPSGPLEEDLVISSITTDGISNMDLRKYNLLPDAKYIYRKEYYATDYDTNNTLYNVRVFRVLERATYLSDLDKITSTIQNEYIAREKYGVQDASTLRVLRLPDEKMSRPMYFEDKEYLDPRKLMSFYENRTTDLELMHTLIDDSYTNLTSDVIPLECLEKQDDDLSKKEKIAKLKRMLKSEISIYENLLEKPKSFNRDRDLEMQKYDIQMVLHTLLVNLMYRNIKKKEINYSVVRHLATLLIERNEKVEALSTEYIDNLIKSFEELEVLDQESYFRRI